MLLQCVDQLLHITSFCLHNIYRPCTPNAPRRWWSEQLSSAFREKDAAASRNANCDLRSQTGDGQGLWGRWGGINGTVPVQGDYSLCSDSWGETRHLVPLVKRHTASAVNWLWLYSQIGGWGGGWGAVEGLEGENRLVTVLCVLSGGCRWGGQAMSCYGYPDSCETQRGGLKHSEVPHHPYMVPHCFKEEQRYSLITWNPPHNWSLDIF